MDSLRGATPTHWVREDDPIDTPDGRGVRGVIEAIDRWRRFAPALATLFKAQIPDGEIESELLAIPRLVARYAHPLAPWVLRAGQWASRPSCTCLTMPKHGKSNGSKRSACR
jgi:hypothetical protein